MKYAITVTIGQVACGLLLALVYVFYLRRRSGFIRTLFFFPVVLPTVAVAQLFSKMVEITPQYGLLNSVLTWCTLPGYSRGWDRVAPHSGS